MRKTIASPTQQFSSPGCLHCSYKRGNDDRVTAIELFHQEWRKIRSKRAGPEANVSTPTTGRTLLWVRTHSGEIVATDQCHKKKPEWLFPKHDSGKVSKI
jgi:hypothetical protein